MLKAINAVAFRQHSAIFSVDRLPAARSALFSVPYLHWRQTGDRECASNRFAIYVKCSTSARFPTRSSTHRATTSGRMCPRTALLELANRDVEHMLFNRALAGVLTRLRTLDWQVLHGHLPKRAALRGANLDVLA